MNAQVVRIRWCVKCRAVLPAKCSACQNNSARQPHVIEEFELPPVLETAACRCCVKIACEVPARLKPSTCLTSVWRPLHKVRRAPNRFCSKQCAALALAESRVLAVKVKCKTCPKIVVRPLAVMKKYKHAFCSQVCRKVDFILAREARLKANREEKQKQNGGWGSPALLACYCPKHRGEIVEHKPAVSGNKKFVSLSCSTERTAQTVIGVNG